ncbi:hypothetical protein Y032_0001g115 [Ancylostoma ceylanicum]|uniref:mitogen-activated protein kinase kinase n=1 Tax=Ancylostoma ceylanicum TaxID=53326 RepID=A0A016W3F6_9BILA|nr:hypothetical protein Y032_0001g115 [Ancylostoma ceylanicum]
MAKNCDHLYVLPPFPKGCYGIYDNYHMVITMSGIKGRFKIEMPKPQETPNLNLDDKCKIKLTNDSEEIEIAAKDLEVLEELGKGGYGVVDKMRHRQSGIIMAVKRISSSINEESQKRMLTELDACKRSDCCPQVCGIFRILMHFWTAQRCAIRLIVYFWQHESIAAIVTARLT